MMKATLPSRALVIRINLVFLASFLVIYLLLLLRPSSSSSFVRCSLHECRQKVDKEIKMKAVLEETDTIAVEGKGSTTKLQTPLPTFLKEMSKGMKIGLVNLDDEDVKEWKAHAETIPINFQKVSDNLEWKDLFPEWIDEEEENEGPSCPEITMPELKSSEKMDVIVAKLPCKYPENGWVRDVYRLQVHLAVANAAVTSGKRDRKMRTTVVFLSKCRPMPELFRCDDLIGREGDWWVYRPEMSRLEQKMSLPVGSCQLSLPIWKQEGINEVYDVSQIQAAVAVVKREAYATVLHSSEAYVCGAIALAHSLLQTGTERDLILLLDRSISVSKRQALADAGWKIRLISRIRNPRAEKNSYNEYNYSKFRLWQLTDYDKIIFIDSDIIALRNLDLLFHFPQMSATGNDVSIFNSGVMVIEPSNCTFQMFMSRRNEIISYNGGDQGFLNEIFVWWHRLPRRVNFLKNFWSNTTAEKCLKNELFGAEPPKLYAIHYLGLKPWLCYRDYDCNWNIEDQRVYASDVAHRRWWQVYDRMEKRLQRFCGLTKRRRIELDWDRRKAREMGLADEHWKMNISDPRRVLLI